MSLGAPALEAHEVCVSAGGRSILENVSLRVECGQFVCLCGPNGGGKTTLVKAALGLLPLERGSIHVLGEPPSRGRRGVGYVPQRTSFDRRFPATVGDVIVANLRGRWPLRPRTAERRKAVDALARVGGEGLIDKPLAGLSGGETQRAFLARALVREPRLLILDEPTAGVDARGRGEFTDLLAEIAGARESACLLVTHNRAAIERLADAVIYLDHRVVASGSPARVFAEELSGLSHSGHDHVASGPACEEE
jgi:zinc transport system ATP-binding protein